MAGGRYRHGTGRPAPATPSASPPAPPPPSLAGATPPAAPAAQPPPDEAPFAPEPGPWPYAPPGWAPQRPRWETTLATLGAVGLAIVAFVALLGAGLWVLAHSGAPIKEATHDQQLADPVVIEAAQAACARLDTDLAAIPEPPATAPAARRASAITAENAAIARVVRRLRALGTPRLESDPPALAWAGDWEALVQARELYARDLVAGRPAALRMPHTELGAPVVDRIDQAVPGCVVPERLYVLPAGGRRGGSALAATTR